MKLNKILLLFLLALPSSVALRFLQLYFTIDAKTGFYLNESGNYGPILLILILLFTLFVGVFGYLVFVQPNNTPKPNIYTSISAAFLSFAIIGDVVLKNSSVTTPVWQTNLLRLFGVAAVIYFIIFSVELFKEFQIPKIINAIPVIYFIVKIICDFTAISKLAMISDNVLLVITYCLTLLFFLNFAKLYNNIENEKTFKRLLSYGLTASLLCFVVSIPNILINIITKMSYLHTSMYTNISVLFVGVFILSFLLSYFSKKNI